MTVDPIDAGVGECTHPKERMNYSDKFLGVSMMITTRQTGIVCWS